MSVAINCDMGESFGLYKMGEDEAMMPLISVANVACGFHASDPNHMRQTVQRAKAHGVKVGAHPSLPDLAGFGRRPMKIERAELANIIIYQVGALTGFLAAEGMDLNHIKPHGSLYGMAARDEEVAHAICDAADVGTGAAIGEVGRRPDPAGQPSLSARCLRAIEENKTESVNGVDIPVGSDCICVHSDTPNAVDVAEAVRERIRPYLDEAA
jgi:UPF0271 protein